MVNIEFPEKLQFLFEPHRYKVAEGGRGGLKSWSFARALLLLGTDSTPLYGEKRPLRIVCAREIQKSIKDSVHQLLSDQIDLMGLSDQYKILNNEIRGANGTEFGFEGMKHNISNIKSKEGIDIFWVEEAETVSKNSWNVAIPTIRKEGSEIWVSYNPDLEESETHQRFVINPPEDCVHAHLTYRDNPWFPETLRREMEYDKAHDYAKYLNVWEGQCKPAVEGAVFENEIRKATEEGRIREARYFEGVPVNTYWDLGHSDQTAIWFAQQVGDDVRVLRYYSNSREKMAHYVKYVQSLPYIYGKHYLPHDAAYEQLGQEKTIEQQAKVLGKVVVIPRVSSKANSIDAARSIFSRCVFDKENTADGVMCLRRYAYRIDPENNKISKDPEHNIWSHGADAFQCLGMAFRPPKPPKDELELLLEQQKNRSNSGGGVNKKWWV